ncbi:MAG TPA: hypothetical protein VLA55_12305 [Ornithinibacter sp.]|nr:hypothetical protein [Ornithinibacter sp.]
MGPWSPYLNVVRGFGEGVAVGLASAGVVADGFGVAVAAGAGAGVTVAVRPVGVGGIVVADGVAVGAAVVVGAAAVGGTAAPVPSRSPARGACEPFGDHEASRPAQPPSARVAVSASTVTLPACALERPLIDCS